jgi:hypothetical protein
MDAKTLREKVEIRARSLAAEAERAKSKAKEAEMRKRHKEGTEKAEQIISKIYNEARLPYSFWGPGSLAGPKPEFADAIKILQSRGFVIVVEQSECYFSRYTIDAPKQSVAIDAVFPQVEKELTVPQFQTPTIEKSHPSDLHPLPTYAEAVGLQATCSPACSPACCTLM